MLLTGPGGVRVRGAYGDGVAGRSITRKVLDQWLIERAVGGRRRRSTKKPRSATSSIADGRVAGVITTRPRWARR